MSNKQSSVDWFLDELIKEGYIKRLPVTQLQQAKAMQKQQAEHYATFITNCVNNNLPTITFNDWINLENNEQQ